jgi:hypothetical protein
MDEDTAGIMITNPNTLGLFEEHIHEIARIVHDKGGQVYCDGANMNADHGDGPHGKQRRGCAAPEPSQDLFRPLTGAVVRGRTRMRGASSGAFSADRRGL